MLVFKALRSLLQGQSVGPFPAVPGIVGFHPDCYDAAALPTSLLIRIVLALSALCQRERPGAEQSHGIEVEPCVLPGEIVRRPVLWLPYLIASHRARTSCHHDGRSRSLVCARRTSIGRRSTRSAAAKAAKLSGIKTERLTFLTFVNMGVLAALAGLVAARLNTATPKAAPASSSTSSPPASSAAPRPGVGRVGGAVIG
jgi:putative multiple sugar transport system permease protein